MAYERFRRAPDRCRQAQRRRSVDQGGKPAKEPFARNCRRLCQHGWSSLPPDRLSVDQRLTRRSSNRSRGSLTNGPELRLGNSSDEWATPAFLGAAGSATWNSRPFNPAKRQPDGPIGACPDTLTAGDADLAEAGFRGQGSRHSAMGHPPAQGRGRPPKARRGATGPSEHLRRTAPDTPAGFSRRGGGF